jgi:hypothetical protein
MSKPLCCHAAAALTGGNIGGGWVNVPFVILAYRSASFGTSFAFRHAVRYFYQRQLELPDHLRDILQLFFQTLTCAVGIYTQQSMKQSLKNRDLLSNFAGGCAAAASGTLAVLIENKFQLARKPKGTHV